MLLLYLGIGAVAFVFRPRAFRWPDPGAITLGGAWWVLLVLYLTFSWTASEYPNSESPWSELSVRSRLPEAAE